MQFDRNILARVGKAHGEMVTATIRTIFAQPDAAAARAQLRSLADRFPAVADALLAAEDDLLAFTAFPKPHWAADLVDQPPRAGQQIAQAPRFMTNGKSRTAATSPTSP